MDALPRMRALLRLTEAVSRAPAARDVGEAGLDYVATSLAVHRSAILLMDDDGLARFKAWRGISDTYRAAVEGHSPWKPGSDPRPLAIPDVALAPEVQSLREALLAEGIRSLAFIPLRVHGRLIGKLMLYGDRPQPYSEEWLREALVVGDHLAVALDRHLTLDRLRDANALLAALAESLPEAVAYVDADDRVRYLNRRMLELLGVSASAILGHDAEEIFRRIGSACADPEGVIARWREDSGGDRTVQREEHLTDGRVVERTYVPVPSGNGGAGRLLQLRDVTTRRRMEEQLHYAHKMESVGRLAGGVAHDFNNMLTAMIGYVDLVSDHLPTGSEEREYLAHALEAAEQASSLTRQLLTFSRRQPIQPSPQDLNALIDRMAPLIRRLVPASIEIVTRAGAHPAWVRADGGQLEQVLVNLVFNARDAMPEGGVLTLATSNPTAGFEPHVVLEVADNGVGMDAETLQHVFEPFWTTKEPGRGSGLGLATVYAVIAACGGRVEVQSEPGRGAAFRVLLPRTEAPAGESPPAPGPIAPAGHEGVLLVEDDASVRGLVTAMLGRLGYAVLAAERADEALRLLERRNGSVDLLIADIVMPGMSGRELAVRALAGRPGLRVLLMSGYAPTPREAQLPGGLAFLPKPFSIETLAQRVRETLAAPAPDVAP